MIQDDRLFKLLLSEAQSRLFKLPFCEAPSRILVKYKLWITPAKDVPNCGVRAATDGLSPTGELSVKPIVDYKDQVH